MVAWLTCNLFGRIIDHDHSVYSVAKFLSLTQVLDVDIPPAVRIGSLNALIDAPCKPQAKMGGKYLGNNLIDIRT